MRHLQGRSELRAGGVKDGGSGRGAGEGQEEASSSQSGEMIGLVEEYWMGSFHAWLATQAACQMERVQVFGNSCGALLLPALPHIFLFPFSSLPNPADSQPSKPASFSPLQGLGGKVKGPKEKCDPNLPTNAFTFHPPNLLHKLE